MIFSKGAINDLFTKRFASILSIILISLFVTAGAYAQPASASGKTMTYITSLKEVHGKLTGTFNYIQWYFGKDADREFLKDCGCKKEMDGAPDGYYIRDASSKLRSFPVSKSAAYFLQTRTGEIKWNEKVTKQQFLQFVKTKYYVPYKITIKNGVITSISEQYIP